MTPTPNDRPSQPVTPASAIPTTQAAAEQLTSPRVTQLSQWNVVLINDADHSYNYITSLLRDIFKLPVAKAVELAAAMSKTGRAICMTTHKEHAEFKRDQIMTFGKDYLVDGCPGSMSAVVEQV